MRESVRVRKHAHAHDHDCTHACAGKPTHTYAQFPRLYSVKDNVLTLCIQCVPGCAPNVGRFPVQFPAGSRAFSQEYIASLVEMQCKLCECIVGCPERECHRIPQASRQANNVLRLEDGQHRRPQVD
jgi:hypothetical protein